MRLLQATYWTDRRVALSQRRSPAGRRSSAHSNGTPSEAGINLGLRPARTSPPPDRRALSTRPGAASRETLFPGRHLAGRTSFGQRGSIVGLDRRVVLTAREDEEDLNGDGDWGDEVLFVFDARSGLTRNLRQEASSLAISGNRVVFSADDTDPQGHTWELDPATGRMAPIGPASVVLRGVPGERYVLLAVKEIALGQDLNQDGEVGYTERLHVLDRRTGSLLDTGIETSFGPWWLIRPLSYDSPHTVVVRSNPQDGDSRPRIYAIHLP